MVVAVLGISYLDTPFQLSAYENTIHDDGGAARKNTSRNGGKSGMMRSQNVCVNLVKLGGWNQFTLVPKLQLGNALSGKLCFRWGHRRGDGIRMARRIGQICEAELRGTAFRSWSSGTREELAGC
jgi:hypothetical protein